MEIVSDQNSVFTLWRCRIGRINPCYRRIWRTIFHRYTSHYKIFAEYIGHHVSLRTKMTSAESAHQSASTHGSNTSSNKLHVGHTRVDQFFQRKQRDDV
jgi:hypothetical protein